MKLQLCWGHRRKSRTIGHGQQLLLLRVEMRLAYNLWRLGHLKRCLHGADNGS